jgi:hypothetical protein
MRYFIAGFVMVAGLAGLVINAASDDSYYGDGTSHWDHAGQLGSQPLVVGAGVVAALATLWVFARALSSSTPPFGPVLFIAAPIYAFAWFIAWTSMAIGH